MAKKYIINKNSRILVTGAAGFMGSHLVDELIKKGCKKVYGVDDMSGGYRRNVHPKSKFTKFDLRDKKKTETYINKIKPELIYHLAADATEGRSQFTPISATERNYLAYLYTIAPAIQTGKLKKVVLTSSMSVYGGQKPPFTEDMERKPEDVYAISKSAMERSTEILSEVHGFSYVIIRPHNVYGPRQNLADPYRNVIGIFINCLLRNKNFYIYGDGQQTRAFSYIDDFTPYIVKVGFSPRWDGEIFNIGPIEEFTINYLAQTVLKEFFGDSKKVPQNLKPKYLPSRPKEVKHAFCSHKKAQQLLGYKTSVSFEEGVRKMIQWAKEIGPQRPKYLEKLEIVNQATPKTWLKKLI